MFIYKNRLAFREHTLTIIEPYLWQMVEIKSAYYVVPPALASEVAAFYKTGPRQRQRYFALGQREIH